MAQFSGNDEVSLFGWHARGNAKTELIVSAFCGSSVAQVIKWPHFFDASAEPMNETVDVCNRRGCGMIGTDGLCQNMNVGSGFVCYDTSLLSADLEDAENVEVQVCTVRAAGFGLRDFFPADGTGMGRLYELVIVIHTCPPFP